MSSSVLTLVIALILLAGVGLLAATWRRRKGGRRQVPQPSCGNCGYPVRGLESFTCPECGSDLREVGIATPAMRRGPGPVTWAVLWTLFLPSPAVWVSALLADYVLPTVVVTDIRRSIYVRDPSAVPVRDWRARRPYDTNPPMIPGVRNLTAHVTGRGVRFGEPDTTKPVPGTKLTLTPDALTPRGVGPLTVDLTSGAWHYTDATGRTVVGRGPLLPATIRQYLADAGFDTADQLIDDRAKDVHALTLEVPQGPGNRMSMGKDDSEAVALSAVVTTRPQPVPWASQAAVVFWEAVWLAGIVWIVRRRRSGKLDAQ